MIAALVLWLSAAPLIELVNQDFEIPGREWRYVELTASPPGALLACDFESAGSPVRVAFIGREELDAWRNGRGRPSLAATPYAMHGRLRLEVHDPDVDVAIDNPGPQPARVHLRVLRREPYIRYLSRQRKLAVILISFGIFFAIVTFSARKLLRGMRK